MLFGIHYQKRERVHSADTSRFPSVSHRSPSAGASQSAKLSPVQSRCASRANRRKNDKTFSRWPSRGWSSINSASKRAAATASTCPTADNLSPSSESSEATWVSAAAGRWRRRKRKKRRNIYFPGVCLFKRSLVRLAFSHRSSM